MTERAQWVVHGRSDECLRGEVNDHANRFLGQQSSQQLGVSNVTVDRHDTGRGRRSGGTMPGDVQPEHMGATSNEGGVDMSS